MCAPSMPPPPEPSTRLSRVVPQEACFSTDTSVMPYLSKNPLTLAMISGAESVRAIKPSLAVGVSGGSVEASVGTSAGADASFDPP